ncbi:MAG: aminotransferase [Gammaproteobacteria bacterium]|nr:aminotransferase [Gammaproteobacteria bacterium]
MTGEELQQLESECADRHAAFCKAGLALDLTRGKPASDQLDLANHLDGALQGDYRSEDGTDTRNYGGLRGIAEARRLGSILLDAPPEQVLAGGNSSLTLMYLFVETAHLFGLGAAGPWRDDPAGAPRILCPVPGYDRHFALCEQLGIEMINVPMLDTGPDMDAVEAAVREDPRIRGIWCVPKYANPTGCVYDDATVARFAELPKLAAPGFRILWDNAYTVHDLSPQPPRLASLWQLAVEAGSEDGVVIFGSTSKISFAGAGVAFMAASDKVLGAFEKRLGALMIGPDKVNQLRHSRLFPDADAISAHMQRHAAVIRPKFDAVQEALDRGLAGSGFATWTRPEGGYFVSVDTLPGMAREVIRLAAEAGVKLTPAGSTYPYGRDPEDRNIRLAPTFPPLEDVRRAMEVFVNCVRLAGVRSIRQRQPLPEHRR